MIRRSPRSTRTATLFPTRRSSYLVDAAAEAIQGARVFVTQLEQPVAAARRALEIARAAGVTTVFNPAPAAPFDEDIYPLCDYVVPNETEAAAVTGPPLDSLDDAHKVGDEIGRASCRESGCQ